MPKVEKLTLKIPPNSLFQPISTDYANNLTFTEFLLGVLKKLNEMIDDINYCEEFIENYDGAIEKLEKEFAELVADEEQFKEDIQFSVNNQLANFRYEVVNLINAQISTLRRYVDQQDQAIYAYIDTIVAGGIMVFNPITGLQEPLQEVIYALYDIQRDDALTATEYDALELTATAYEAYDLTATQYDMDGKTLLV